MHGAGASAEFLVEEVATIEAKTAHGMAPDGIQLDGRWSLDDTAAVTLPPATVVVTGEQRLLRLAAQLLDPQSNDGLFTYEVLGVEEDSAATRPKCPVLQLLSPVELTSCGRM